MNINLTAPINDRSYGIVGTNLVIELSKNHEVCLWPIGQISAEPKYHNLIKDCIDRQNRYDPFVPSVRIWHQFDLAQHVGWGLRIGFPIFELNKFNERERHHLWAQDRLLVCSKWAKEVLGKEISSTVHVVPLGVNTDIFNSFYPQSFSPKTIFLNCGKWEKRKGHDVLVEIFNKAFSKNDNVELWMSPHNPFLSAEEAARWENLYKNSKLGEKIKILPWVNSQRELAARMNEADCGIFPSRAEGWNLELLEMMACGKHIIATNYSAHTEFVNDKNSYLIEIEKLEKAEDGKWFFGHGEWAQISGKEIDMLALYMRHIHSLKQSGQLDQNKEGLLTAKTFSWKNSADKFVEAIS